MTLTLAGCGGQRGIKDNLPGLGRATERILPFPKDGKVHERDRFWWRVRDGMKGMDCCRLVAQSCHSCNLMDCSPPGSSVHGISQAKILERVAIPSPDLPDPGIKPLSPALAGRLFTTESHQESPKGMDGGGGLVAKSYLTIATTPACQAPLSMGFSR